MFATPGASVLQLPTAWQATPSFVLEGNPIASLFTGGINVPLRIWALVPNLAIARQQGAGPTSAREPVS